MKTHVKAFTYDPKIEAVRSGLCRQTIRMGWTVRKGDKIRWHGWTGTPYFSKWSWRFDSRVTEAIYFFLFSDGFCCRDGRFLPWSMLDDIAALDHIECVDGHSIGESMGILFNEMHKGLQDSTDGVGKEAQIIRWVTVHQTTLEGL